MGGKPSNNLPSDRPESGGADKDMEREKSGLLEREKEKFAIDQHEKFVIEQHEKFVIEQDARREAAHRDHAVHHAPFSVDHPHNPDPHKK
jgi:hypothetical protein